MISMSTQVIEIEFSLEKCDMLMMNSGTKDKERRIELLNQESIRLLGEKGNYK